MGLAFLAGLYARFKGLGTWQLATDEYFIVKSAENILKYGIPEWDVGGYYSRGLILQYFTAFLLSFGIKAELAARILPAVANLLSLPALYLLSKKISGKHLAAVVTILFSLSLWEIEFSRFARMYTLFQSLFIWYCYFLYKYIIEHDSRSFNWLLILSVLGVFTYEGSVFLVILNFLPIFWDKKVQSFNPFKVKLYKEKLVQISISVAIFIFAYFFLTFDFRTLYLNNVLPPDVVEYFNNIKSDGFIRKPILLIKVIPSSTFWSFLLLVPITLNIYIAYKFLKSNLTDYSKVALLALLVFSFFNLLGLTLVSFIIFSLIHWIKINELDDTDGNSSTINFKWFYKNRTFRLLLLAFFTNFIFWILFSVSTSDWQQFFPKVQFSSLFVALKTVIKDSLNYPYLYETFALFRDTIPNTTIIIWFSIGLITAITLFNKRINKNFSTRFLIFVVLLVGLIQNSINLVYFETRYFFFLYPLVLVLLFLCFETVVQIFIKNKFISKFVFLLLTVLFLFVSEDFGVTHLKNIDSKKYNFRTIYPHAVMVHYYPRWDSKSLTDIINHESIVGDIIITNEHTSEFYLNRLDYFFNDYRWSSFPTESAVFGTKERWTNSNLIYQYSDLNKFIDTRTSTIWFILNTVWTLDEQEDFINKYSENIYGKSLDGRLLLFRID